MDEKSMNKLDKKKISLDLFDQISKRIGDIYEGKGNFSEYVKSREEKIMKIKEDILNVMYGPGFKENLLKKKLIKKSPKSNILLKNNFTA